MDKVDLVTDNGKYVITAAIPPFKMWPEVLIWGSRVFQLETKGREGQRTRYKEVFAVVVTETSVEPKQD